MLPINVAHPEGRNNIFLATHARSIGELRSSKKRTARAHVCKRPKFPSGARNRGR
jgi:hypothetical protein